jgi:hypothetical protein
MSAFHRVAVLSVGVVVLLGLPSTASAGGWWSGIDLDKSYVAPGQSLKARTGFLFATVARPAGPVAIRQTRRLTNTNPSER